MNNVLDLEERLISYLMVGSEVLDETKKRALLSDLTDDIIRMGVEYFLIDKKYDLYQTLQKVSNSYSMVEGVQSTYNLLIREANVYQIEEIKQITNIKPKFDSENVQMGYKLCDYLIGKGKTMKQKFPYFTRIKTMELLTKIKPDKSLKNLYELVNSTSNQK